MAARDPQDEPRVLFSALAFLISGAAVAAGLAAVVPGWAGPAAVVVVVGLGYGFWRAAERRAHAATARLREAAARQKERIDRLPVMQYRSRGGARQRFEYVSKGTEKLTGYSAEQLLASDWDFGRIIYQDDRKRVDRQVRRAAQQQVPFRIRYRIQCRDGRLAHIEEAGVPVEGGGRKGAIEGVIVDATEAADLERRLQQAQKFAILGRMAGGVAHDLNNILGAAQLSASSLSELSDERAGDVAVIRSAVESSAELARQLLLFGRDAGDGSEVIRLRDVVRRCEPLFKRLIGKKVHLRVNLGASLDRVTAVPSELQQLLLNLVVNAHDATEEDGEIAIETEDMEFTDPTPDVGLSAGDYARLTVRDNGRGMDAQTRERMFEPFFSTKGRDGVGLGMAIVHAVVRHNDGTVVVNSEPGVGTTVEVYFPRARISDERPGAA